MVRVSEHDQVVGDRIGEWDELLFAAEWQDDIPPEYRFRGWDEFIRGAQFEDGLELTVDADRPKRGRPRRARRG